MSSLSAATLLAPLELKFLLSLLPHPHYRAAMTEICPQPKLSGAQRDRLCQQLRQRHWIDYEEIVTRFGLTACGRTLLNLDTSVWPITPDEKYVLQSCQYRSITPGQIAAKVPDNQRQRLIVALAEQQLVRITHRRLGDVWLTVAGQQFLRDEYVPQGDTLTISWTLMGYYLQFMRRSTSHGECPAPALTQHHDRDIAAPLPTEPKMPGL